MTVLAILAGTLFFIVQGSLRAASEVERVQRENRRVKRFIALMRQTFDTFPSGATVELDPIQQAPSLVQELTIRSAPQTLVFGKEPTVTSPVTISLRQRPESLVDEAEAPYYLGITRRDFFRSKDEETMDDQGLGGKENTIIEPDEKGRYWLELLPTMKSLEWQFYNAEKKRWEAEKTGGVRPPLIELKITPFERQLPIRVVFAIK